LIRIYDRPTGISSRARSIAVYSETRLVTGGLGCAIGVDIGIWGSGADGELAYPDLRAIVSPPKPGLGLTACRPASVNVDVEAFCKRFSRVLFLSVSRVLDKGGVNPGVDVAGIDIFWGSSVHGKSAYPSLEPLWIICLSGVGPACWLAPVCD
jgi:hypothetical protein